MTSMSGMKHIPVKTRFKLQYQILPNGCWEWTGYRNGKGRPVITVDSIQVYAHRFSYATFVGPIPAGLHVCHHCDNKGCVNPEHLFVGNQNDNMQDMKQKLRANRPFGGENGRAKLTLEEVKYIRKVYKPRSKLYGQQALATRFNVCPITIYDIVHYLSWPEAK